ncbi:MAG TPA: helix-turn-helix domain-containing protein, partial [Rhodopila sp.]|nr:helix-turn-helix domain-containing protein [Rhodopila sp.]
YGRLGIACDAERHLGIRDNFAFADVPETTLAAMIRAVAAEGPDAIGVICTNLRAAPLVEALERETGVPIYDSVATAVWKSLAVDELITPDELPRWVPGEPTADSAPLGWDGIRLRGFRYAPLDVQIPALSDYALVFYQDGATPMHRRCRGDWRREPVAPGSISLLTHAAPSHWRWSDDIEVMHLYLSPAAVADIGAQAYDHQVQDIELRDVLRTDDPVLSGICAHLARESREHGLDGRLYVEALRNQACLHLLRHYADVTFRNPVSHGGLSRAQGRLVLQYIDENLDGNISLSDLAGVVQLSVFHFMRKFRAEFGCPPHAFVMRRRIEHAQRKLARRDVPLKVVAADCGFADQSHMTRLFRRVLGATPAEYRRSVTG